MEGKELDYADLDKFVLHAFYEAVAKRGGGGGAGSSASAVVDASTDWEQVHDKSGNSYWHNTRTGETSWNEVLTAGETADRMIMQIHDVEEAEHKSRKSSQEKLLKRRSRKDPSLLVEHSVRHTAALEEQRATEAAEARERLAARRARESPRRQTPRHVN
jgi:hypothetical protein